MADRAVLIDAGRRCITAGDWGAALEHLSAAQALGTLESDDLELLARSMWMLGRVVESLPVSEEAYRRLLADGRRVDGAMSALRISLLWFTRGDETVGRAWLARARRILGDEPDSPTHAYLAYLEVTVGMAESAESWAPSSVQRLDELARRFPEPAVEALSLAVAGLAELQAGRVRRGFALLDEAMLPVLAEQVPEEWAGDIYCTTIHISSQIADFRRMEGWTAAMERWCSRFGSESIYTGICRVHRLELRWAQGAWADAEERIARQSADLALGDPFVAGAGFTQLGEMRRMRGDVEGARQAFARAREVGIDPQPGPAMLELHVGDVEAARAAIADALAARGGAARVRLLRAAVEIAVAAGAHADAAALASELQEGAERYDSEGFRAWSEHAHGMVALARGELSAALATLRAAETMFRRLRQPFETARMLALIARTHEAAGQPQPAAAAQEQAHEILQRLGAVPIASDAADDGADGAGHGARIGPLTARETEVLARVALGDSNRDVAAQLFISEKTVGRHLANIYLKLGVGTRTAAAAWWHERTRG
ncbi:regulatory protein, luxR family [Agrococcus baldri]|uniref:Regulatory protein, luxR family n=1 Tax=Agrococcus baldri TaxID=153730 RepID=A0AA94L0R6_9MICO|nr:helix-turn-helix transcriptional regulator [Agrococcus baldri]SFS18900.1 regulatory protein, luxR family [Agrococcus baldri]